ncbi:MAG: hypothetical protein OQJ88_09955, partial [Flavobacteriales bacterium]|nr:hypothetical protein [Flavobacteriales bacterium]
LSCFMLGNPILPVYKEEIQCRGLGMKVEAFNEDGKSLIDEKGELVCTEPFPAMPIYFWNDEKGEKYKKAYFSKFKDVWTHGDYIRITKTGGVVVYGRSDATLNPGGIRIGTAEIYRIVETMDEVADSIVVGQRWNNDVNVVLFVVLKDEKILSQQTLIQHENNAIKNAAIDLLSTKYELNDWGKHNITVNTENNQLEIAVINSVHAFKLCKVKHLIKKTQDELRGVDDENQLKIIQKIMLLEQVKAQLSDKLGIVIVE